MKFIGRKQELNALNRAAKQNRFQMYVIYGRRRIGKTSLIKQFSQNHRTLWFTAREQSPATNLADFSRKVLEFFNEPNIPGGFPSWDSAIQYLTRKIEDNKQEPILFVFDEFPYAAISEPGLPSLLQIAIDHHLQDTNTFMILCGSNEGFMESQVLGYKSPLYGRRTGQIHLKPFDIFDAAKFMPADSTWEDRVHYYAALGGTPYYLQQIDDSLSFAENIENLCFDMSGILYEEPLMLLRQELREPAIYNSLLETISSGKTKVTEIAGQVKIESTTVIKYLKVLESLGLIERSTPFGEKPFRSKKGLWKIKDPFFDYWYRFVSPNTGLVDMGAAHGAAVTGTQGPVFETYVGQQFEDMCIQWMLKQCSEGRLDFVPTEFGKWWGSDPKAKEQTDVDVVMSDSLHQRMILGECKWRNSFNESETIGKLFYRSELIKGFENRSFYLFSKLPLESDYSQMTEGRTFYSVNASEMFSDLDLD